MSRRRGGCLITLLIIFVVIALAIVGVGYFVFNSNAEDLKMADKPLINEKSLRDMNLHDVKIKEAWPLAKTLYKKDFNLATYTLTNVDFAATNNMFNDAGLKSGGEIMYSSLLYKSAKFGELRQLELTEKVLTVIFREVARQSPNDPLVVGTGTVLEWLGNGSIQQFVGLLEQFKVQVEQITLTGDNVNPQITLLMSMDISDVTSKFNLPIIGAPNGKIYLSINYALSASDSGSLTLSNGTISLNGCDSDLSAKVLNGFLLAIHTNEDEAPYNAQTLTDSVATFVQMVFNSIGKAGTYNGILEVNYGAACFDIDNKQLLFVGQIL